MLCYFEKKNARAFFFIFVSGSINSWKRANSYAKTRTHAMYAYRQMGVPAFETFVGYLLSVNA